MQRIHEAAKRRGISVWEVVREAALMRATMITGDTAHRVRAFVGN